MLCLRCLSRAFAPSTRTSLLSTRQTPPPLQPLANHQQRPLSLLSRSLTRPKLLTPPRGSTKPLHPNTPSSAFQPFQQPQSIQARGAIRDTFNPSHRVRKRRHGFLSRVKTRNGRKTLKRRRAKRRSTLSH